MLLGRIRGQVDKFRNTVKDVSVFGEIIDEIKRNLYGEFVGKRAVYLTPHDTYLFISGIAHAIEYMVIRGKIKTIDEFKTVCEYIANNLNQLFGFDFKIDRDLIVMYEDYKVIEVNSVDELIDLIIKYMIFSPKSFERTLYLLRR